MRSGSGARAWLEGLWLAVWAVAGLSAVAEGQVVRFNFRGTGGFVVDNAGELYVTAADTYPTTRDGVTFGWVSTADPHHLDRDASVDPRLAGVYWAEGVGTIFRVDLDGAYVCRAASGTASGSFGFAVECRITDGTDTLLTWTAASLATHNFVDASGTLRTSEVDWVRNNEGVEVTTDTGFFRLEMGTGSPTFRNAVITHLSFEPVTSNPSSPESIIAGVLIQLREGAVVCVSCLGLCLGWALCGALFSRSRIYSLHS